MTKLLNVIVKYCARTMSVLENLIAIILFQQAVITCFIDDLCVCEPLLVWLQFFLLLHHSLGYSVLPWSRWFAKLRLALACGWTVDEILSVFSINQSFRGFLPLLLFSCQPPFSLITDRYSGLHNPIVFKLKK